MNDKRELKVGVKPETSCAVIQQAAVVHLQVGFLISVYEQILMKDDS